MDDYISKPVDIEKLTMALERAFERNGEGGKMNRETLIQHNIDCDAGIRRFMGDRELYEEVLAAFLEDDSLSRAESAYEQHDYMALFDQAHAIKGASGNLDMTALYVASSELTEYLRHNDAPDPAGVSERFETMRTAYKNAAEGIAAAI